MFEPDRWPTNGDSYTSDVILVTWRETPGGLCPLREINLGPGNDPRIAIVNNAPIVLFRGALHSPSQYYLYDVVKEKLVAINVEEPWFDFGKNWAPFDHDGHLGSVHGFDPLRILQIDTQSGTCDTTFIKEQPANPKAAHDGYTMFRGGTNALSYSDHLIGLGHATFATHRHYPFTWSLADGGAVEKGFNNDFMPILETGFGIIDPTSVFYGASGQCFVAVCCSERDWFFAQRFANIVLPAQVRFGPSGRPEIRVDAASDTSRKYVRTLVASELHSNIPSQVVPYGARRSVGQEGYLASGGPFLTIPPGRYQISYRYRSSAAVEQECGIADCCLSVPGFASPCAQVKLYGTADETRIVQIEADVNLEPNERFSVRVYTDGKHEMTLYDVTQRML